MLKDAVSFRTNASRVLQKIGVTISGGSYERLKATLVDWKIDGSNIVGRAWNKGRPAANRLPIEEVLVDGIARGRGHLKRALDELGIPYMCSECGQLPMWNEKPLVIPIDHIDGNRFNNRKENIRYLCPNCHSQTETWGYKGKRRYNKKMVP